MFKTLTSICVEWFVEIVKQPLILLYFIILWGILTYSVMQPPITQKAAAQTSQIISSITHR